MSKPRNTYRALVLFPEEYPGYFAMIIHGKTSTETMIRRSPVLSGGTRIYVVLRETGNIIIETRTFGDFLRQLQREIGNVEVVERLEDDIPEWSLFDAEERDEVACACGCGARFIPTNKLHVYISPLCVDDAYSRRQAGRMAA